MVATQLEEEVKQVLQREAPAVSVIVPSYNHAQFVEATLRSIFDQTLPPAELIVIDDGSIDDSPQVIDRVLRECPFPCELVSRSNLGLCATLNEGFARSRGDYFAYLGSDDLWLPEFLNARAHLLENRPSAVLAYGHAYFIDEQNRIIDCTADWASYADGDVRWMLLQTIAPMSPTVVYRRRSLERHQWNEQAKLEDYDLYLRLSTDGDFAFDPQILSAWRRHGSNVSWDQDLMLEEQLHAQRRAALDLGFNDEEIEKLQTKTRFQRAEDFLRLGQKSQAATLMRKNWRGLGSLRGAARMFMRLLIPNSIVRWRVRRRQRRAHERYGTL
jgi:alpha-1,3-rhamnosyltransferase